MKHKPVWVEFNAAELKVVRIFKSRNAAIRFGMTIARMAYDAAVDSIRHQLWLRCRGECEMCGDTVIEKSGHMHEIKSRGKGGEISLANSVFACPRCHILQHDDRNPKWTKTEKNA